MATERLQVILQLAAGQYKREAREAATATGSISQQAKGATTATGGLQSKMVGFGSVLRGAAVTGGFVAVGHAIGGAIAEAEEAASIMAITEQVIRQTGGAANLSAQQIADFANQQALLTGVEDDLVQEGLNVLLTFKNLRNEVGEGNDVFSRTGQLMLDVGATMGTDATSAALQLGKALNDPVSQMGALSRAGLTFTAQQKDQIKALVESGDLLSAQKLILSELESQLGGTAAASADATDKIANQFKEMQEGFGTFLLPFVEQLNIELTKLSGDEIGALALQTGLAEDSAALLAGRLTQVARELERTRDKGGQFNDTMADMVNESKLSDDELRKLRDGLPFLVKNFDLTAVQAEFLNDIIADKLAPTSKDMADNAAGLEDELDALRGVTEEYGSATAEVVPSAAALAFEVERAGRAAKFQREQMLETREALRTIHDPLFRVVELQADLVAANEAVTEAANDPEAVTSGAYRDAVLDRARIISDLEQTYIDLKESGIDPTGAAAQLMLEGLEIPPGVLADIIAGFDALEADFESREFRMQFLIPTFEGQDVAVRTGNRIYRHAGGPGTAGMPYVIKPHEEIFVPSGDGQFLLNDQVIRALRGLNTGGSREVNYNIPIQSSGNQNADAQLVGAVASVLRRMETL